jgi:predicted nucleic acid-binding protein
MSGNVFVDTNVFVYAHLADDSRKHEAARELLKSRLVGCHIFVSTQVLNEFYAAMSKNKRPHREIVDFMKEIISLTNVSDVSLACVERCLALKEAYGYSYWDSLILAAALESNCDKIYSEDMQHGQIIEKRATINNPFYEE